LIVADLRLNIAYFTRNANGHGNLPSDEHHPI
jgi:hypothetical protein